MKEAVLSKPAKRKNLFVCAFKGLRSPLNVAYETPLPIP